ncbi:MAG: LapA family protein [Candidatus Eisenbacteria bacterium]
MNISRVIAAVALLVITVAIIAFGVMNPGERVMLNLGWRIYQNVPLILTLFIAFVIGIVLTLLYSLYYFIEFGLNVRRLKKRNRALEEELVAIRNLPIEEPLEDLGPEAGKGVVS